MDDRSQALPRATATIEGPALGGPQQNRHGGHGLPMAPAMQLALDASFGSVERWRDEFVAQGKALGDGAGRVLLVLQPREGRLVNQTAPGQAASLADGVPLLALDRAGRDNDQHAGAAAGADVDAFVDDIDWAQVYQTYQQAVHAASETYGASQDEVAGSVLLDVRRAGVFDQAATMIPRARWCDPASVARWAADLPIDQPVIVHCVYGHEVGRATVLRLRAAGVNARFLRGGIDGWQAAGRPLERKVGAT